MKKVFNQLENENIYYKTERGVLIQDDCQNVLNKIPDKSINLIYTDLPFGKTQNTWDSIIPAEWMWKEFNRILADNGVVVLHAMEEFSAFLMMSNLKDYKFRWYWQKDRGTGHLNAKKMPLRNIEDILVFSPHKLGNFTYNPQMTKGEPCHSVGKAKGINQSEHSRNNNYGNFKKVETEGDLKYPKTLLYFPRDKDKLHETQKPLLLAEYLIKTHSNENDVLLDISSGVSTSGLACEKNNRYWINIEKDIMKDKKSKEYICAGYCEKAKNRFNTYFEDLWRELEDKTIDNNECLTSDFYIWKTGTSKDGIWGWFNRNYSLGLSYLVNESNS